jgi:hypothetical protein
VREKPVIAKADAEPATQEHQEKKSDLKPVESEMPKVEWNRRERKRKRADEKRTGRPVDAMDWKTGHHIFEASAVAEAAGETTLIGRSCGEPYYSSVYAIAERKIRVAIGMRSSRSFVRIQNLLRREELNAIERGDDFTANEQLLQIVAIAEPFVAKEAKPEIFGDETDGVRFDEGSRIEHARLLKHRTCHVL